MIPERRRLRGKPLTQKSGASPYFGAQEIVISSIEILNNLKIRISNVPNLPKLGTHPTFRVARAGPPDPSTRRRGISKIGTHPIFPERCRCRSIERILQRSSRCGYSRRVCGQGLRQTYGGEASPVSTSSGCDYERACEPNLWKSV